MESTTVAVDLAKSVFEVAVANERGQISERKRFGRTAFMRFLTKRPPCRVVMEACGTAHYWGRVAQEHGHQVTLLPPNYVRPFVRRNKTDRADAEALVDASRVERIPAVPIKRPEQQALVALHRVREQWMTTRTARINALRGLLGEHGLNLPPGAKTAVQAVPALLESATALPAAMRRVLASVHEEVRALEDRIAELDRELRELAAADPVCALLQTVPGIGLLGATTLVGTVGHIHAFSRGRQFASWVGLTAARILERRPPTTRTHQQTRRPLPAVHADPRWPRGGAGRGSPAAHRSTALPPSPVGAAGARPVPLQPGHRRGGQQARPAGLGRPGPATPRSSPRDRPCHNDC